MARWGKGRRLWPTRAAARAKAGGKRAANHPRLRRGKADRTGSLRHRPARGAQAKWEKGRYPLTDLRIHPGVEYPEFSCLSLDLLDQHPSGESFSRHLNIELILKQGRHQDLREISVA